MENLAFFAYPSFPPTIGSAIRRAVEDLTGRTALQPITWESLGRSGSSPLLISDILEAIDASAVATFEVTLLNQNVLFELGYAIGRERRIWLLRDPSHSGADRAWQEFQVLTGIRYTHYQNSWEISVAFEEEQPWAKETVYSRLLEALTPARGQSLLYLKSRYETDAERELSRLVDAHSRSGIPAVIADPAEASAQPLAWYAEKVYDAAVVMVHMTGTSRVGAELHNARCSLIAGMAHGMGRPLLMLAEAEFFAPLDYRDLLKVYESPEGGADFASGWLDEHLQGVAEAAKRSRTARTRLRLATELSGLRLGDAVAEMEAGVLEEYFVPTAAFNQVLAARTTVFVGRKGTGKTANLLRAAQLLESDRRNLVCVIKPAGYELESLVRLLSSFAERDAKGYLVESLWKFLLVSEIALTVYRRILERAVPPQENTADWDFAEFMRHRPFLLDEFAVRLEKAVTSVLTAEMGASVTAARAAISERMHVSVLRELRVQLGRILRRTNRVCVLIDNLDKTWDRSADIDQLSYLLLGLLASIGPVSEDFAKEDRWRESVQLSVAVFLRSDIFGRMARVAREPDRLPLTRLVWNDPEQLLRVVEDRYRAARNGEVEGSEMWEKFFVPILAHRPVREYVAGRILPRPRDLILFCNAAISTAVNRGHSIVEASDVADAEQTYSLFALEALKVEASVATEKIEEILYEFVGAPNILARDEVLKQIHRITGEGSDGERVVEQLRSLGFFGIEVEPDRFSYAEEGADRAREEAMVRRFEREYGRPSRLQIHSAYRPYLEIGDEVP